MAITPYRASTDLFRPFFEDFFPAGQGTRLSEMLRAPEADVVETEHDIRVTVELPGMKADNIDVDLENNVLTIRGEKQEQREEQDEQRSWHLSERRYGRFTRSFVLPRDVEQDSIDARFEDGVLEVRIPKSEKARRRRIAVQDGGGQQRVEAGQG